MPTSQFSILYILLRTINLSAAGGNNKDLRISNDRHGMSIQEESNYIENKTQYHSNCTLNQDVPEGLLLSSVELRKKKKSCGKQIQCQWNPHKRSC